MNAEELKTNADYLQEQAEVFERLLPELHRRLFALEPGDPITELPMPQLRMFMLLRDGPMPFFELGERLGVSPSSVTQIADRLEGLRLVKRIAGVDDRRVKRLQLTAKGQTLLTARRARRVNRVREALERLPADRREEVLDAFMALIEASLGGTASPPPFDPTLERTQV